MSASNMVILIGFSADQPKLKQTDNGKTIASVAIYTKDWHRKDKKPDIHRCIFFGKNAHRAHQLIKKGSHLHCVGTIKYQRVETKKGHSINAARVWIQEFSLSPSVRPVDRLKETVREIIDENHIASVNEVALFKDRK